MSDTTGFGFGKFVPGFDFLQNLTSSAVQGASSAIPQMPNLGNWVAPTLNVEELDKRIEELKAVQFWLDQNALALKATIQALEVQKMTLATLKGMNFSMSDVANAFKIKATETVASGVQKVAEKVADTAQAAASSAKPAESEARPEAEESKTPPMVDPALWWGALTQQFQQIASNAFKDAAMQTALDSGKNMAMGLAKEAMKSASAMVTPAAKKAAGAKAAVKKAPAKKAPARAARKAG